MFLYIYVLAVKEKIQMGYSICELKVSLARGLFEVAS
jgi:hypothetical protein